MSQSFTWAPRHIGIVLTVLLAGCSAEGVGSVGEATQGDAGVAAADHHDAGRTVPPEDAGAPVPPKIDASAPLPSPDAGPSPVTPDAAPTAADATAVVTVDAGTTTDAGMTHDAGGSPAACGCGGKAGCAVWTSVYVTFYGFNDNSCTVESQHNCNTIAFPGLGPKKHPVATEATGTYDDPITAAASDQGSETAGGATLSPGTIIYNPMVKKYFIMEDSCLECGDEWKCHLSADDTDDPSPPAGCVPGTNLHIDFWMGPSFQQDATTLNTCEDNSTIGAPYKGVGTVVVNPPPDLPVVPTLLYSGTGSGGGCWTSKQATAASCP